MDASVKQKTHNFIIDDVWFHLSYHIDPEDLLHYSLICSQSANSMNSCTFWFEIYQRHCMKASDNDQWIFRLPEHLQMRHLKHCNKKELRQKVIQALFYCYAPLRLRLQVPYTMDSLIGRTYLTTWYKDKFDSYTRFLIFKLVFPIQDADASSQKYGQKWGKCAFENMECKSEQEYDGIRGLNICSKNFIDFPHESFQNEEINHRLAATREFLADEETSLINLELDFISADGGQVITVTFPKIEEFKVYPWWHPKFRYC